MRKNKLFSITAGFILVVFPLLTSAQTTVKEIKDEDPKKQSEKVYRTINDLKTGNWQDVISSFLQLSVSDLTGENKSLNFKANLFALKAKADSNLLLDYNYVRQKFARNFQFDFSLNLDTQYHFKGFQTGFTWAIINKRDSTVASFVTHPLDAYYSRVQDGLQAAAISFRTSLLDQNGNLSKEKEADLKKVNEAINKLLAGEGFAPISSYPKEFQEYLAAEYDKNLVIADSLLNYELKKLRLKPLLTLSVNSTFKNEERAFKNGVAQLVYLQGVKTKNTKTEIDIRASLNIKDTLVITTDRRTAFNSSAGINFALVENSSGKSIIEFKPHLEYDCILTKPYPGEEKDRFLANADLRFRIFENLWLPLIIKYDLAKGKLLGFLDIEFNFGAFKKQK